MLPLTTRIFFQIKKEKKKEIEEKKEEGGGRNGKLSA